MENQTVEHFDASDWPRDFDVRAEVAEQAELLDADDAHELTHSLKKGGAAG